MKYAYILFVIIFCGCKKYETHTISGNTPPIDATVANSIKNNFVNRLYIKLLDRKADSTEFIQALNILNEAPENQEKRKEVIQFIKGKSEYHYVMWKHIRELLLDGTDTATINKEYNEVYDDWTNATGNTKLALEYEWKRLEHILNASTKLKNNQVDWQTLEKQSCNNLIYDDINMGTENFIVSVFQNLIHRYPTIQELDAVKDMVNGRNAVLFLQQGSSKDDFLDIFFNARSYYEGQAQYVFKTNIFRTPTSQELDYYTNYFLLNQDFEELYFELLSSDTYFLQ